MRTATIFVFVLLAASPAQASKSCMTMAEARAQFATSHLWWHGPNHCWDATPNTHRIVRRVKKEQQAKDDAAPEVTPQEEGPTPEKREPKWRDAMSEMLPAQAPSVASALPSLPALGETGLNWLDRWVDVAQVAPPSLLRGDAEVATAEISPVAAQKSDPMVTPVRLILVFLSIVVILAVIELLFRNAIHERLD